jgi:serine/threonine protein kinase
MSAEAEAAGPIARADSPEPDTVPLAAEGARGGDGSVAHRQALRLGGRYEVADLLAQGGMSRLYSARDLHFGDRLVVIKEFRPRGPQPGDQWALVTTFMREANILGDVRHPHIVRALDFVEEDGSYYIIMEWLGGHNLHRQLRHAPNGLPEAQVLDWARQICLALTYLHHRRPPVIFCDLKPSNIFLLENQQVKLVDFGIARYYFPEADNESLRFGTPGFAAPEQFCAGRISPATDVFGLGRTLHCLLTAFDPAGQSEAAARFDYPLAQALRPDVSARTSQALEGALQADPAQRFPSIEAFEQALGLAPE